MSRQARRQARQGANSHHSPHVDFPGGSYSAGWPRAMSVCTRLALSRHKHGARRARLGIGEDLFRVGVTPGFLTEISGLLHQTIHRSFFIVEHTFVRTTPSLAPGSARPRAAGRCLPCDQTGSQPPPYSGPGAITAASRKRRVQAAILSSNCSRELRHLLHMT